MRRISLKTEYISRPLTWMLLFLFAFTVCTLPFMHRHAESPYAAVAPVHAPGITATCLQNPDSAHKRHSDVCIACQWGLNSYQRTEAVSSYIAPPVRIYSISIRTDHLPVEVSFPCTQPRAPPQSIS